IFISETRVAARSNQRTQKTPVKGASDHPILTGVDTTRLPPLEGFAETKRRATAETAIVTVSDDRPILASWRYGLGKVVALATDLRADWKGSWAQTGSASQVLRQSVRYALRRQSAQAADLRVAVGDRTAEVTIEVPEAP